MNAVKWYRPTKFMMANLADDDDLIPEAANSARIGLTQLTIARAALEADKFQLDALAAKFRRLESLSIDGDFTVVMDPYKSYKDSLASWCLKRVSATSPATLDRVCELLISSGFAVTRVSTVEAHVARK